MKTPLRSLSFQLATRGAALNANVTNAIILGDHHEITNEILDCGSQIHLVLLRQHPCAVALMFLFGAEEQLMVGESGLVMLASGKHSLTPLIDVHDSLGDLQAEGCRRLAQLLVAIFARHSEFTILTHGRLCHHPMLGSTRHRFTTMYALKLRIISFREEKICKGLQGPGGLDTAPQVLQLAGQLLSGLRAEKTWLITLDIHKKMQQSHEGR